MMMMISYLCAGEEGKDGGGESEEKKGKCPTWCCTGDVTVL